MIGCHCTVISNRVALIILMFEGGADGTENV